MNAFGYGAPKRVTCWGSHISNNDQEGVYIGAGATITSWTGVHIYDNSEAGTGLYSNVKIDSTSSTHSFDEACVFGDTGNNVAYDIDNEGGAVIKDYSTHTGGYVTAITNLPGLQRSNEEGNNNLVHVSFDTPGNALAVVYSRRFIRWEKHERKVTVFIDLVISSLTYDGTTSGQFAVQGIPYDGAALSGSGNGAGACVMSGWSKTGYTYTIMRGAAAGGPNIRVMAGGPGQSLFTLTTVEIPSGSAISLFGTLEYEIA